MRTAKAAVALSVVLLACSHGNQEAADDAASGTDSTAAKDGGDDAALPSEGGHLEGGGPSDSSAGTEGGATDGAVTTEAGKGPEGGTPTRSAGCGTAPPHSANYTATTTDGNGT